MSNKKIKLDKDRAKEIFRKEAKLASQNSLNNKWTEKFHRFSELCDSGNAMTHIAFLGVELLAKATNPLVDLFYIKPNHAKDNPNSYSARSLCHSVLVPLSAELGVNIGVTGREPLNNMPYFRMKYLGDGTPVHSNAKEAFDYMYQIVEELSKLTDELEIRLALRSFIFIRRQHQISYVVEQNEISISSKEIAQIISDFVKINSEGGKIAQAVAAGLFDAVYSPARVESGRINDPSRNYPGDVNIFDNDEQKCIKSVEVRDKPVSEADVRIFCLKCIKKEVREIALLMVSVNQTDLDEEQLTEWALERGIGLTLFQGWSSLVAQILYWSEPPKPEAVLEIVSFVDARLRSLEASNNAVNLWSQLTRKR